MSFSASKGGSMSGTTGRRSKTAEIGGFEQDPEVAKLHDKIDSVEEIIANYKAEMKNKTSFYESEIANLQTQIKKKKIESETKLSALRENNEIELQEVDQTNELDVKSMQEQINNFQSSRNVHSNYHMQTLRTKKEAELADLRRQIEQLRIKNTENVYESTTKNQTAKMTNEARIAEITAQIEILDGEIKETNALRQEDLQSTSLKVQQTSQAFEQRAKEQQDRINAYRLDFQKRSAQHEELIALAEQQAEAEMQQMENDLTVATDRCAKMQQTLDRYTKRAQKEEQIIKEDIASLKEVIDRAKKLEEEQLLSTKDQITKLQAASSDTIAIDQEIEALRAEIEQTKADNADMRRERTRLDTTMYSTRLSRFHGK